MTRTVTLSARVEESFRNQVDILAMALGRDRAWIVEQAVRRFLAEEQAFLAAVRQGQADIEAGRFITDDEMEASLDRIEAELATRQ